MKFNSKTLSQMLKNPRLLMEYQTTGRIPVELEAKAPQGPLIDLLESIYPRERARITAVVVGDALGYTGARRFHNAAQALQWAKPQHPHNAPAESWRNKRFNKKLTIDDLALCSIIPHDIISGWWQRNSHLQHLRKPTE